MFTSESVSEGHPDKICDRISDAVLDFCLKKDSYARVACETFATTNTVVVGGEVGFQSDSHSQSLASEIKPLVANVVKDIGYEQEGFHWNNLNVSNFIHQQSSDISQGVDRDGAGDQGIMFGYACSETSSLMPAPIFYAHKILEELSSYRKNNDSFFLPDSKSQVSMSYENGVPKKVESLVVSTQHYETASNSEIREKVIEIIEYFHTLPIKSGLLVSNIFYFLSYYIFYTFFINFIRTTFHFTRYNHHVCGSESFTCNP